MANESIPVGYLLQMLIQWHQCPLVHFLPGMLKDCGSGVFIAEEVVGVGDIDSVDIIAVDVDMLGGLPDMGLFFVHF
jgi:hypothetical protein